tara:strand:- start:1701 stop:2072 length:372 start_codon:yes stop_codon:yes gene_type:complete
MSLAKKTTGVLNRNSINFQRKRINSNDRVDRALEILNDISLSRPDWNISVSDQVPQKRENKSKNLEVIICSICVTDIDESTGRYTTSCGHSFHLECILPWFGRSTVCPNCRQKDIKNRISLNN